jgi:hypothetical protein
LDRADAQGQSDEDDGEIDDHGRVDGHPGGDSDGY